MDNRITLSKVNSESYNEFENESNLELIALERKRKEILVRKVHKNKISDPVGTCKSFRTRIEGQRINAPSYDALIDKLYDYYYGNKVTTPTFEESVYLWANERLKNGVIEYNTYEHYLCDFKRYIEPLSIAKKHIDKITKKELYAMFEEIVGTNDGIKKKTLSNLKTVVNGAFDYVNMIDGIECIDAGRVKITDLKRKCEDSESDLCYTREEVETLLKYLSTLKPTVYTLAVALNCCLPVRIGELRAVTVSDVDLENGYIYLRHQMVCKKKGKINRHTVSVDYMKAHSEWGKREIELSDYAAYIIKELLKINGNKTYLLQSKGNMPISTNNYNEHLRAFCKECGVEYKSSHKIRFYACSMMYRMGIDERTIQKKMGHSNIQMTRHYDRRKPEMLNKQTVNDLYGYEIPTNTHLKE